MKIEMEVKQVISGYTFKEQYDIENGLDPKEWAKRLIDNFNMTLRPGESSRELLSVKVIDEEPLPIEDSEHYWEKQNLVTIMGRSGPYDKMKCIRCGITARRYGFNAIQRDTEYKANIYGTCEGAMKQLEKLKK